MEVKVSSLEKQVEELKEENIKLKEQMNGKEEIKQLKIFDHPLMANEDYLQQKIYKGSQKDAESLNYSMIEQVAEETSDH
eukprot:CAMPEP_0205800282 /NCGR_PEP_ID=MMETSP0205-20121125/1894_1 /ASSEMBLY_ACC=CAM_ASM_000278 /TAXON_ID=36767 /ORGANISM="Euplotes focardii, Strain TN1" /LENGTH=79 /DNA_ID=CAMNT_0053063121 /DNA_START=23 /DNA_END=262 /DNA_ORIENTATION=+